MTLTEIQAKIQAGIENSTVTVQGDGCSCSAKVVSPIFEGIPLLARQKMVLAVMNEEITNGKLHALSIKTRTPKEDA